MTVAQKEGSVREEPPLYQIQCGLPGAEGGRGGLGWAGAGPPHHHWLLSPPCTVPGAAPGMASTLGAVVTGAERPVVRKLRPDDSMLAR